MRNVRRRFGPIRWRTTLVVAALATALVGVLGPAGPAQAFFHPLPAPTGPHHWHAEKNPSAYALSLMSTKEKSGLTTYRGSGRHVGGKRCVRNCIDPTIEVRSVRGLPRRASVLATGTTWCSWIEGWVYTKNVTGSKIWQFTMRTDYCWNDGTGLVVSHHTSVQPTIYTWASALGWEYKGTTEVTSWRPFGNATAVRTYAQGHFDFCPPRIWCVQTRYPYIYLDVYGTGDRVMSKWGW
jgi:hypothetical protein